MSLIEDAKLSLFVSEWRVPRWTGSLVCNQNIMLCFTATRRYDNEDPLPWSHEALTTTDKSTVPLAVGQVEFPPRVVPLWLSSSSALNKCCCRIPPNQFEFLSVPSPLLSSSSSAHTLQQNPRIFFCHRLNRSLDHILIGIKTFPTSNFLLSTDTGLDEEKTILKLHLIPSLNQKQKNNIQSQFSCVLGLF